MTMGKKLQPLEPRNLALMADLELEGALRVKYLDSDGAEYVGSGINMPILRTRAPCCARAASGHAAAPPSSVMNSRRFIRAPRWLER